MDNPSILSSKNTSGFCLLDKSLQDDLLYFINQQLNNDTNQQLNNDTKTGLEPPITLRNATEIIRDNPDMADQVVKKIITQKRRGQSDAFFYLVDLLQSRGKDAAALFLNTHSLLIHENCGDLYAKQIELLLQWTDAATVHSIMKPVIDEKYKDCRSPRLTAALCGLFWHLAKDSTSTAQGKLVNTGLNYAIDLQKTAPENEWGYYWEIMLLQLTSPEEAENKLTQYVSLARPAPFSEHIKDTACKLLCPRCCQLYIIFVLSKCRAYVRQIVHIAKKGQADAKYLSSRILLPTEKAEASRLYLYFTDEIAKADSFLKRASESQFSKLSEVPPAGSPNLTGTLEQYHTKFPEEAKNYG